MPLNRQPTVAALMYRQRIRFQSVTPLDVPNALKRCRRSSGSSGLPLRGGDCTRRRWAPATMIQARVLAAAPHKDQRVRDEPQQRLVIIMEETRCPRSSSICERENSSLGHPWPWPPMNIFSPSTDQTTASSWRHRKSSR